MRKFDIVAFEDNEPKQFLFEINNTAQTINRYFVSVRDMIYNNTIYLKEFDSFDDCIKDAIEVKNELCDNYVVDTILFTSAALIRKIEG